MCRLFSFFIFDLINIPNIAPKTIPERCAMCPVLVSVKGIKIPVASIATQIIAATNIGTIIPNAQTFIVGLRIVRAPMIPMIAPLAPKDEV